jgi:acyl carrier protein
MDRTEQIIQFIEDQFLVEFGSEVTAQSDLFKEGIIDSFGYIQLMAFLKEQFGIVFAEEDILLNVFVTLEAIDGFVATKLAERLVAEGAAPCAE